MPGVIDTHIHIGGPGDSGSGCRMSPEFIFSPAFAAMLIALKATPFDIRDEKIKEIILNAINTSEKIDYAVLLSLDGVYKNGKYIESESHLVTPNGYIIDIAKTNKRVLFGASVLNIFKSPLNLKELLEHIKEQGNPLDNNYNILKEFGIHDSIFTNAWDVLKIN